MELVEVDIVDTQPSERLLNARPDVRRRVIVVTVGPGDADLRRNEDPFPAPGHSGQAVLKDRLASGAAVEVGVVVKGAAALQGGLERFVGVLAVGFTDPGRIPGSCLAHSSKDDAG